MSDEGAAPPMPDFAPPNGPWCLNEWIPFHVPHPKVMVCLREPNHDGDCWDQLHGVHNRDRSMFVGKLEMKE